MGFDDYFGGATAPPALTTEYGQKALDDEIAKMAAAANGNRNDTLNRATFAIYQLADAGHVNWHEAWPLLHQAAVSVGLGSKEIQATMRSAVAGAQAKPRRDAPNPHRGAPNPVTLGGGSVCLICRKPSTLNVAEDLFYHDDGSDNEACWWGLHEQRQAKPRPGRNDANLAGWLNSGRSPAEHAIAQRDAYDRSLYGDRVDDPDPYADEQTSFRDTLRNALVDSGGLDHIPEPEPLVNGILYRDSLAWIQGKRSNGKSFVALDIAGCVGTGHHWQGSAVVQGKVLFIAAEGVSGVRWRVRAWEKSYGRDMDNVLWLPMPVQANSDQWHHLVELVHEEFALELIVLDTQARMTVGMEENAAKDMGEFVDKLEWLRRATGACVLVVHHMGRNGEHMRGSTALEGAATTILQVAKDDAEVTVSCEKQKDAEEFGDIHLKLVPVADSAVLMPSDGGMGGIQATAAFRTAVKWWATFRDDRVSVSKLTKAEVGPERTLYRHVHELVDRGLVEPVEFGGHKFYKLRHDPNGTEE